MHKFFIILGLSVLLFKLSVITKFEENGTLGINEKRIILEHIPIPIYNFFLKHGNPLIVPDLIKFNETSLTDEIEEKELKNLGIFDIENWKKSIKFIFGTLYFMFLIYSFILIYKLIKEAILTFYKLNRFCFNFIYKTIKKIILIFYKIYMFFKKIFKRNENLDS